ncbi:MAG TPA: glycosyltransferase [Dongiaceae bacterium]|nr:glycosyltransferase [Dongiaceae bacterium]
MHKPLKVLQFICPTGFYGAERWILTLAKNLDDAVVQCDLAVTVEPGMAELEVARQYQALGKKVHRVPMQGRFDLGGISRLCALIRAEGYDIIHTHGYKSDILGLIAARLTGIKIVATPHGFENAEDWKLRAYIGLGNQFLKWCDVVAPLSEQLCEDVAKIGVRSQKVRYVQNGVDLDEVDGQRRNAASNAVLQSKTLKRVGFIGQMISRKNIFDLLDIFDGLQQKHGNLELKLLGDGDQRKELEQYTQKLASRPAIEFLGFRNDRLEWLQSFDLFVMTSTLEGIPRCLMETMAMGVPVAAYAIPGIDQLVIHDKTGVLAPLGEKQALAEQWERLLFEPDLSRRIVDNARDFVWNHFSGARMAKEYTDLFRDMVGNTR